MLARSALVFFLGVCLSGVETEKKELHIGLLLPMSGDWAGGIACKPAAMMALQDLNEETSILPGYKLELHMHDSRCSPGLGVKRMFELLYYKPIKSMFLTGCSTVTTFVAQAAKKWNLIVLAYGSSSPALSNRERFPTFFRTHPSASIQNPTRIKLLRLLGWKKIAVLWQMEEVFTSTSRELDMEATAVNITIAVRQSFQKDPSIAIRTLKKADARIIVGLFYEQMARRVFCEAYRQGLYGPKYVWFIIGWYANDWYIQKPDEFESMNCTESEMLQAVEGHITTESVMWNDPKVVTRSGMTSEDFRVRLKQALGKEKSKEEKRVVHPSEIDEGKIIGFQEAPLAYDAVWAMALALDKAERRLQGRYSSLSHFNYSRDVYEEVYRAMNETHFIGVSTAVYFDSSGNRIAWTKIEQMLSGRYHTLGHYHYIDDNLTMTTQPVWQGSRVPRDEQDVIRRRRAISVELYAGLCSLAGLTIILAFFCIAFSVRWRHHPTIRTSQPILNAFMCVGCIVALLGVFANGADRMDDDHALRTDEASFRVLCHVKIWVLSLGFTLGFGALFCKTWTVYRLATNHKKATEKRLRQWEIYVLLSVLMLLDVIILTVWQVVDPLYRVEDNYAREVDSEDEDLLYQPFSENCAAPRATLWLGLNFGWKGLFLMFGLLLAYETRNVKLSNVSDSRLSGMAVYNIVVLCCITAPVSLIIDHQQNALYAFIAVTLILCAAISIGVLFVPKFVSIARHPHLGYGPDGLMMGERSGVVSKEEEEKHQRLLAENEQLKRQIDECETKIRNLHQGLHDRSKARVELTRRQLRGSGRAGRASLPSAATINDLSDRPSTSATAAAVAVAAMTHSASRGASSSEQGIGCLVSSKEVAPLLSDQPTCSRFLLPQSSAASEALKLSETFL